MKNYILLYFLFSINFCFAQHEDTTFSVFQVIAKTHPNFGPDEQQYQWEPTLKNVKKSININSRYTTIRKYDKNGNLIVLKVIDQYSGCRKELYQYDQENRLVYNASADCEGNISTSQTIAYTDTSIIIVDSNEPKSKTVYTLDANKRKIKRQDFFKGRKTTYWTKKYNKTGSVTQFKFFQSDTLSFHEKYKYGKHDELIESTIKEFPNNLIAVCYYGNFGEVMVCFSNVNKKIYKYDESKNQITEYRISSNKDTVIFNYTYDQYGNIKEMKKIENGVITTHDQHEYQYDTYGNIIEEKSYYNGDLRSVRKTEYEYK